MRSNIRWPGSTTKALPLLLGIAIGAGCGLLGTLFLIGLRCAEAARERQPELLYGLPLLGLAWGLLYDRLGRNIAGGNNLIIARLCDGGPFLPKRMVPLSLLGTIAVHLCGGSVGQEGTAMQFGAAWADSFTRACRVPQALRRLCLAAGVGGGFAAVFGAPAAATIFALEFAVAGVVSTSLMPGVLAAALTGHLVAQALGAPQTQFPAITVLPFTPRCALSWLAFSLAAAGAASLFIKTTDAIRSFTSNLTPALPWRLASGGLAVVLMAQALPLDLYLGGGLNTTLDILNGTAVPPWAWLGKLLLTALCLGIGFTGGEVTPLLFMGAALGQAMAPWLLLPAPMAAAVGMAALLSGATRAPLAWTLLITEHMGQQLLPHVLFASVLASMFAGRHRLYSAQRGHPSVWT